MTTPKARRKKKRRKQKKAAEAEAPKPRGEVTAAEIRALGLGSYASVIAPLAVRGPGGEVLKLPTLRRIAAVAYEHRQQQEEGQRFKHTFGAPDYSDFTDRHYDAAGRAGTYASAAAAWARRFGLPYDGPAPDPETEDENDFNVRW